MLRWRRAESKAASTTSGLQMGPIDGPQCHRQCATPRVGICRKHLSTDIKDSISLNSVLTMTTILKHTDSIVRVKETEWFIDESKSNFEEVSSQRSVGPSKDVECFQQNEILGVYKLRKFFHKIHCYLRVTLTSNDDKEFWRESFSKALTCVGSLRSPSLGQLVGLIQSACTLLENPCSATESWQPRALAHFSPPQLRLTKVTKFVRRNC